MAVKVVMSHQAVERESRREGAQIPSTLDELGKEIEALHALIGELEARLQPVLSPHNDTPKEKGTASIVTCSVASMIYERAEGVRAASKRINLLLGCLEV